MTEGASVSDKSMSFGQALAFIQTGHCVARAGWNGKNMHIYLIKPAGARQDPYLAMFTAQGTVQAGWLASQADILAHDWEVV